MPETDVDRARMILEDAIYRALEGGMTKEDIRAEVEYTLENTDDE